MGLKLFILLGLVLCSSIVFASSVSKFVIVKDIAYVPSPINPNLHDKYVEEHYDKLVNVDGSISFVLKGDK
jgi:hypothetical protein